MTSPFVLIDGSSYFFRAFHALPPLTNATGLPTGAIYGVANMIKRLIKDYQPEHLAVVFDAKGKTFRDDWYPEYKAHRPPMPDDLRVQFQPLVTLLTLMGLPLLIIEGVEADDVIGTLALQASAEGRPVVISTGDKDMAQLVNTHITLINTMSNLVLDEVGVFTKFQVTPTQIIDYLALIGDTSDNVPGIPKCGPKTAAKWLEQYQTVENLVAHADEITGKIGENLRANLPQLALSKKLVTLKTDVALPLTLNELTPKPVQQDELIELVRELGFKNWLNELLTQDKKKPSTLPPTQSIVAPHPEIGHDLNALEDWINQYKSCPKLSLYIDPIGISLSVEPDSNIYISLPNTAALTLLKPMLENATILKIGHNLKRDYTLLKHHGIALRGITFDTMLESYLLNSSSRNDLDTLVSSHLESKLFHPEERASIILQLHHILYPLLVEPLKKVLHDIEIPLLTVLADIECLGVLIDTKRLAEHGQRLKTHIALLETEALQLAGKPFNLNSPKQLQAILYDDLHLPILSKTPKGQPSTAESVLQELAFDFRLPEVILQYRSLTKLVSTYIDALPKRVDPKTHRVHTSYNQAVTATGRLSSSDPNLQNIPVRTEEGRLIRKAFIAPPDYVLLAADYSQIELRIMAHLSQDANLLKAFANGWDIHTATASEIFAVPLDEVTSEQRRRSKAVNFGLIYGMSSFGLAKQIGVERQEAQTYIDLYFQRYPGVLAYMDKTRQLAHQQGFVETLFGRRLYLPEINTRNMMRQKAAERTAINAPMQGTAADIIKKAMLAIADWQNQQNEPIARMIMQVHDELVFEVQQSAVESVKKTVHTLMEQTVTLSVPLLVSIGVGQDWDEAH